MKKILVLAGAIAMMAFGCVEDKLVVGVIPLGSDFSLPKEQTALIDGINSPLSVEVIDINDNRCPIDYFCIAEGNYSVDLSISDATQTAPLSLCNLFCDGVYRLKDTASVVLNEKEYFVVLKDIIPYPGTDSAKQQEVILTIFR